MEYLTRRHMEALGSGSPRDPSDTPISDVLALYARDIGPTLAAPETLAYGIIALAGYWGDKRCSDIKGATCRAYVEWRSEPRLDKNGRMRTASAATARRELGGVLSPALRHAVKEGVLTSTPVVTLPGTVTTKGRWLTRSEVAKILRASAPHLRRFILISVATGTRSSAVLALRWHPSKTSGWVDAEAGIIHRRGTGERETKKRRGSVRAPRQLAAHLRRWKRMGGSHVIMWRGAPIAEIDTAFKAAARRAGIEDVTIHDLKRTAVTWFFQRGGTMEDAEDWFSTTRQALEVHYRQHSPEYQRRAQEIMERRIIA